MSLAIEEQETHISMMRDEKFAQIYTSDSTMMNKLDKMCVNSPENYSEITQKRSYVNGDLVGKFYKVADKSLISFRGKKVHRELSDEQRAEMAERMRAGRKNS